MLNVGVDKITTGFQKVNHIVVLGQLMVTQKLIKFSVLKEQENPLPCSPKRVIRLCVETVQSIFIPHSIPQICIVISPSYLGVGLPNSLFLLSFWAKIFKHFLRSSACCKLFLYQYYVHKAHQCRMDLVHSMGLKITQISFLPSGKRAADTYWEISYKRDYSQILDNTWQLTNSTHESRTSYCQRQIVGKKFTECARASTGLTWFRIGTSCGLL